jgi:hypothetical protein
MPKRRPDVEDLVDQLGPGAIALVFVVVLALTLWGCHSGTP